MMMASTRAQVLAAVAALLETALPYADVRRNAPKPDSLSPGGVVNMNDGDPGEPDLLMSPLELAPPLGADDPVAALDAMCLAIGAAVRANRTLGGLAEFLEADAPVSDDVEVQGAESLTWGEVGLTATYTTSDPLG
jgi:hypothetical protein